MKKLATGEFLDSDVKFGGRKKGRPHLLTLLDANKAFDYGDDSFGRRRRTIKLDFPYQFGDGPDERPKDPLMKEKITSPEALNGLAHIIMARASSLIKTRRIYQYKSSEQVEMEFKRQRFSLHHFVSECIGNVDYHSDQRREAGFDRLRLDDAHKEYLEYCRRFNIPAPAAPPQLGTYIKETFDVSSSSSSETVLNEKTGKREKKSFRYYEGLCIIKPAAEAYADHVLQFSPSTTGTTAIPQHLDSKINISEWCTTGTTDTTAILEEIIEEIYKMYDFINSCQSPRRIFWENYVENAVVSVVPVVQQQCMAIKCTTVGTTARGTGEGSRGTPCGDSLLDDDGAPRAEKIDLIELCEKTILILEDVPTFVGLDGRTWTLKKGDVTYGTLPLAHAQNLVKNGLARVLEGEPPAGADYEPIAENLAEADRRQADFDAHFDTSSMMAKVAPELMMTATAEQVEALRSTATKLIVNWPEITPVQLGLKTYEVLGVSVSAATAEVWLESEGWTRTGTKLNGSETWIHPDGWGEDDEVEVDKWEGDL